MRFICLSAFLVALAACNRDAVTQPSPHSDAFEPAPDDQKLATLGGWVFDTAGRPIEGATVQILSGPRAGDITITSADGTYTFGDGFPAAPEMQAGKSGYRFERAYFYAPLRPGIRKVFFLGSLNPPVDLGGTYDVTFTADPACDTLPADARSRRYLTTVSGGTATSQQLTLTGADFLMIADRLIAHTINMSAFENFVVVHFTDPPIWEKLAGATSLFIYGSAEGEITGPTSHLTFWGYFEFCGMTDGQKCQERIACQSNTHTLTLVRR